MPLFLANTAPVRIVTDPTGANLGYFDDFMRGWGAADQATRDQVYTDTVEYRTGEIDGQTEVNEVSAALGIASAPNVTWSA